MSLYCEAFVLSSAELCPFCVLIDGLFFHEATSEWPRVTLHESSHLISFTLRLLELFEII